ncbi:MAG TPA: hypothetical protein VGZ49_10270 [Xanthobacteraceae bacterium]|jgi:hypothetical protein|nr:hypothetical protein [Xanthobacteraceae bacterium]
MVVGEAFAGLSAIKTALDIVKGYKDLTSTAARNRAVIELTEKLFAAQKEQSTLTETIANLEKRVMELEDWQTDKQRYQLADIGDGAFAFALKPSMAGTEEPHYICQNCYHQNKKSILNHTQSPGGGHLISCQSCGTKFVVQHGYVPPSSVGSVEDKARLALSPCSLCEDGRLKVTGVKKDPVFGPLGLQRRTLTCDRCGHVEERQYDPGKGSYV